ncbi:MAG: hypothetical protein E7657_06265 [Ruminococcaceae bacterium]|nr:hypothetical protein [Oscillospiraceae bacterium]
MARETEHRAHPVRNFFYVLYSFLNIIAFVGFFYALYSVTLPMRTLILILTGIILALALAMGVIRPLFRARR